MVRFLLLSIIVADRKVEVKEVEVKVSTDVKEVKSGSDEPPYYEVDDDGIPAITRPEWVEEVIRDRGPYIFKGDLVAVKATEGKLNIWVQEVLELYETSYKFRWLETLVCFIL